jgi:hypothetical protein
MFRLFYTDITFGRITIYAVNHELKEETGIKDNMFKLAPTLFELFDAEGQRIKIV